MNSNQKGVIHLVLLIVVFLLAIGVIVAVMVFKPDMRSVKEMTGLSQKEESMVSPTTTPAETTNLEAEVNAEVLTDPSSDFTEVDQDINSL